MKSKYEIIWLRFVKFVFENSECFLKTIKLIIMGHHIIIKFSILRTNYFIIFEVDKCEKKLMVINLWELKVGMLSENQVKLDNFDTYDNVYLDIWIIVSSINNL